MSNILSLPGQINLETNLGKIIFNLIIENNFDTIVDIGTWNGLGTTSCILQALNHKQQFNSTVYTIELYPDIFEIAKINLNLYLDKFKLHILNGTIVEINEVYSWFDHSMVGVFGNEVERLHAQLWYEKDIELLKTSPNVLEILPQKIDLLILDGGEYSTYPEWQKLKNRTKFFVLDDTNTLKCTKIKEEILLSKNYTILYSSIHERNGYLVGYNNKI